MPDSIVTLIASSVVRRLPNFKMADSGLEVPIFGGHLEFPFEVCIGEGWLVYHLEVRACKCRGSRWNFVFNCYMSEVITTPGLASAIFPIFSANKLVLSIPVLWSLVCAKFGENRWRIADAHTGTHTSVGFFKHCKRYFCQDSGKKNVITGKNPPKAWMLEISEKFKSSITWFAYSVHTGWG